MSDDIVTQLREIQWEHDKTWQDKMSEAADEIERLRAELQLTHSQIAIMATAKVEEEPF